MAIVAYYKAVHIAEAVFYEKENPHHRYSTAHKDRGIVLKTRYADLWRNEWPLLKASKAARYLEYEDKGITRDVVRFSEYMPGNVVQTHLLNGYLVKFEATATRYLPDPTALNRFRV